MRTNKYSFSKCSALACLLILGQLQAHSHAIAAAIESVTPPAGRFDFSLPDLKDNSHALSDYRGSVVLVNFWASWCPPCIHEMPALQTLQQNLADRPFVILAINVGEKKYRVRKFTRIIKLELPVLLDTDNDTFNHWGVKTLPTSFLVDADGTVRYRVTGNPGWDSAEAINTINKLLSESLATTTE